jgi:hypothetical protein
MAGYLSDFVHKLIGADNPSTQPYDQQSQLAQQQAQAYAQREQQAYDQQRQLALNLWGAINGIGPSVAGTQLQQTLDQNNRAAQGMASGASGTDSVLARYMAQQAQGQNNASAAQTGALLRAQEVAQNRALLGQQLGGMSNESGNLYGNNLQTGFNYAQLGAGMNQENAQRDTVLGAAGLQGASSLGSSIFSRIGSNGGGGNSGNANGSQ